MKGKVFLVGAGPGDPELLTLKAWRALKTADVVLHDELTGPEILALVPKTAQLRSVGKRCGKKSVRQEEINAVLIQFALLGLQVVRLKGGDPLLFGRAGEEIEALRQADIEVEIIPGVTAALAAAAAAQIPLTHRQVASALVVLTGHHSEAAGPGDWPASLPPEATVVVYMPGYHYENTARRLRAAGLAGSTPCAIISQATSAEERVHRTTLEALSQSPHLPAPTLLVVGEVVRFADHASLRQQFSWTAAPNEDFVSLSLSAAEFLAEAGNEERSE
jgi:uroporphyrin-III C-methyltransferase